jgi:hypothetical protein
MQNIGNRGPIFGRIDWSHDYVKKYGLWKPENGQRQGPKVKAQAGGKGTDKKD